MLLAGFLLDKDLHGAAKVLVRLGGPAIAVTPPVPDRARPALETAAAFRRRGIKILALDDSGEGFAAASALAGPSGTVLVTGSLFLVGRVLEGLRWPN